MRHAKLTMGLHADLLAQLKVRLQAALPPMLPPHLLRLLSRLHHPRALPIGYLELAGVWGKHVHVLFFNIRASN